MCGIIGIYRKTGLKKADAIKFAKMIIRCQKRGTHATGMFNQNGTFLKAPVNSARLTRLNTFKAFLSKSIGCKYMVGHCRLSTRGNPKINKNNHPIFDKPRKTFLVHNGWVDCKEFDKTPDNTDTWIFMHAILEKMDEEESKGKTLHDIVDESLSKICDKATRNSSVIVVGNKNELIFAKNKDKPLLWKEQNGCLVFGSETVIINDKSEDDGKEFSSLQAYRIASVNLETGEITVDKISYQPKWTTWEGKEKVGYDKDYLADGYGTYTTYNKSFYNGGMDDYYGTGYYQGRYGNNYIGRGQSSTNNGSIHGRKIETEEIFFDGIGEIEESLTDDEYIQTFDDEEIEKDKFTCLVATCMQCEGYDPWNTKNYLFAKGQIFCTTIGVHVDMHSRWTCTYHRENPNLQ